MNELKFALNYSFKEKFYKISHLLVHNFTFQMIPTLYNQNDL